MNRFESIVSVCIVGILVAVLFGVGWEVSHQGKTIDVVEHSLAEHSPTAHFPTGPPTGTTNPPIKVRGGAMTFFRMNGIAWSAVPGSPNVHCTNVQTLDVNVEGFADSGLPDGLVSIPTTSAGSAGTTVWTIKFDTGGDLKEVKMEGKVGGCNGTTSPYSVSVTYNHSGTDGFYGSEAFADDQIRIMHPSCRDSARKDHDEDFCERMKAITIPILTTKPFDCPDLDCSVFVGQPEAAQTKH